MPPTPPVLKAFVYALHRDQVGRDRLLVFSEPDYPEAGTQVPGGTVEPGEAPLDAASREFAEETGLRNMPTPMWFATVPWSGSTSVERHCYTVRLTGPMPDTWDHVERTPHDGGGPVVMRFRWLTLSEARTTLSIGMGDVLDRLPGDGNVAKRRSPAASEGHARLGLRQATLALAPHEPTWAHAFDTEAVRIRTALADVPFEIAHIGSTAVPGLPAKPILDIAMRADERDEPRIADALVGLGYIDRGVRSGRLFIRLRDGDVRTHNLHLYGPDFTVPTIRTSGTRSHSTTRYAPTSLYATATPPSSAGWSIAWATRDAGATLTARLSSCGRQSSVGSDDAKLSVQPPRKCQGDRCGGVAGCSSLLRRRLYHGCDRSLSWSAPSLGVCARGPRTRWGLRAHGTGGDAWTSTRSPSPAAPQRSAA